MERTELIHIADQRVRLIRTEYHLTQDKMASVLGLSKKTLVEIEKGRTSLGWTGTAALCSIFSQSEVLKNACGGDPLGLMNALAFEKPLLHPVHTMGGPVWWTDVHEDQGYRIQQNIISHHYRLLDPDNNRLCSSFDLEAVEKFLAECLE